MERQTQRGIIFALRFRAYGARQYLTLGGAEDDPMSRAVGAVGLLADRVGEIRTAIERAGEHRG